MQKKHCLLISDFSDLNGKFLIATPYHSFNELFKKSIIYVVSCNSEFSIGIIINQKIKTTPSNYISNIFLDKNFGVYNDFSIFLGGPTEATKGFVLHSSEYDKNVLFKNGKLSLSSNSEIIKDIADGIGPEKKLFVLGYTYWDKGQIEQEINNNYWVVAESNEELIFSQDIKDKWEKSLEVSGIDYTMFSNSISIS